MTSPPPTSPRETCFLFRSPKEGVNPKGMKRKMDGIFLGRIMIGMTKSYFGGGGGGGGIKSVEILVFWGFGGLENMEEWIRRGEKEMD